MKTTAIQASKALRSAIASGRLAFTSHADEQIAAADTTRDAVLADIEDGSVTANQSAPGRFLVYGAVYFASFEVTVAKDGALIVTVMILE